MNFPAPPARAAARLAIPVVLALAACRGGDKSRPDSADSAALPDRAALAAGFQHPESARYDSAADVFYISNIVGDPSAKDGAGFISRMRPDGTIDSLHFIQSGRNGVTLNAPKGLALVGDTLWVADLDAVRAFDKNTGAPILTIDLSKQHALFLNDVAAGPDGAIYITDTGMRSEGGQMTHVKGGDKVFRIAPSRDHAVTVALHTDDLQQPNGITWDSRDLRFIIVSFGGSSIFGWRPPGGSPMVIGHGGGQLDGVEFLPDNRLLVTSWKDSSLYVRSGNREVVVKGFPSPADIGVDTRRNHVAVPLLLQDKVDIWNIPPLAR
ncbi:MAG TPA: SMP-30/gluconolactonase/LRE family protein [Gemmatimonadaceae bacterium]